MSVKNSGLGREIHWPAIRAFLLRRSGAQEIGSWLRDHADLAALAVIAAGLVIQIAATRDRSFDPDEALHYGFVNLAGPVAAYQRGRTGSAHPPLFFFALYLWKQLGNSQLFLRLLPEAFGAGFLWLAYRWAGRVFGRAAGFLTLLVLFLSPAWLPLSTEVRHYSLMLLLSMAALLEFEKSADEGSPAKMVFSFLFLSLAVLTHYSAIFIAASLASYELARLLASRAPRRLLQAWALCQAGVAAVYLFLYVTQVRFLRGGDMEERAVTGWLRPGYFQRGRENPFWFVARQTWELFRYFFGPPPLAAAALLLVVIGLAVLARKRSPSVVLLGLPFLFGAAAGLVGVYPFSGTRHSVYLLPFFAASIGVALSSMLAPRRRVAALAVAVLAAVFWAPPAWSTPPRSLTGMNEGVEQFRLRAAPSSLVFTDHRTGTVLSYYLGRDAINSGRSGLESFRERNAGGYCFVDTPLWTPGPKSFVDEFERMVRVYRLPAGQRLWVVRLGSEYDVAAVMSLRLPGAVFPTRLRFGDLSIVEVWLGDGTEEAPGQRGASRGAAAGAGQ